MNVEVKTVPVSSVTLNPDNPRTIQERDLGYLVKSLRDFPEMMRLREIVVDESMTVLGGNMRLLALRKAGEASCTVKVVSGLSPEQKREFIVKDNASFGAWDFDALANSWDDLPLVEWGVKIPEDWAGPEKDENPADAEAQVDRAEELNKTWQVKAGDLFHIGDHRLLCGDSTKAEDVARAMGGGKANLMVTDPPYGVDYDPEWRLNAGLNKEHQTHAEGKVQNDDREDWRDAWSLFDGDVVYVWHAGVGSPGVADSLKATGFILQALICWGKPSLVISRGHYHHQHEPCWYGVRKNATASWAGDRKQSTLWDIPNMHRTQGCVDDGKTSHSTQKPLECMARPIRNHDSEFVYDPFLGSGTTMVACQNLQRKCRGLEISPAYCAVILQRMTDAFPGVDIKRVE